MDGFVNWLAELWNNAVDFVWRLVLSLYDILKDFLFFVVEELMAVGVHIADGFGTLLSGLDVAQYFSLLPPETAYMLSITGFSEALGMIITALSIRFIIQMIPLVRWGS